MLTIIWRTIKDRKVSIIVYCLAILGFMWMFVALYPSIQEEGANFTELFQSYPEEFLKAFNMQEMSFATLENFLTLENFSIMWPIIMLFLVVAYAGNALACEIEKGTAEILLAKPISRTSIFLARYLAGIFIILVFCAVSVYGVIPLAEISNVEYNWAGYTPMFVLCLLFAWAVFSLAFMVSAMTSEKSKVYMVMGGGLVLMYVLNVIVNFKENLENIKYASFFYYYDYNNAMISHNYDMISIMVFASVAAIATVIGLYWFNKRDIAV
ncbi:ABC transporter permease [Patescibacteria group bacterium]|nr:ABC transporter permease [Patescibacteria group bacterium]MBU1673522.1 ABC transporter permease [Patescibacteria group bacterium]MBU1963706.1 ABC transporter permease [Patescibacteria group bacterium]